MKKLTLFLSLIFGLNLYAVNNYTLNYNLTYDLLNDEQKVGTLHVTSLKNKKGVVKYFTKFDLKYTGLLKDYSYSFDEEVIVHQNKIASLEVNEKENNGITKVSARMDGDYLVYNNGAKLDLNKIQTLPFDFKPFIDKKYINKKTYQTNSFDTLSGKLITYQNNLVEQSNGLYKVESIDKDGYKNIKTINSDGLIVYMKNDFFEARLVR